MTFVQLSEELRQLESKYQHRYAPFGLQLMKCMSTEELNVHLGTAAPEGGEGAIAHLYLKPVTSQQEDIMALVPLHHPFYVKDKGET